MASINPDYPETEDINIDNSITDNVNMRNALTHLHHMKINDKGRF